MRGDDGLGQACIRLLERDGLPGVKLSGKFQLLAEDAYEIAASDTAVFVDASTASTSVLIYEITPRYSRRLRRALSRRMCPRAVHGIFQQRHQGVYACDQGICWDLREG
jgi:hypothetical protein